MLKQLREENAYLLTQLKDSIQEQDEKLAIYLDLCDISICVLKSTQDTTFHCMYPYTFATADIYDNWHISRSFATTPQEAIFAAMAYQKYGGNSLDYAKAVALILLEQ